MSSYWDNRWNNSTEIIRPVRDTNRQFVEKWLSRLDIKTVLDFGGGIGKWKTVFESHNLEYYCYDISPVAVTKGIDNGVIYESRSCDLIFTNTVLIHTELETIEEIKSLEPKYVICLESCWTHPPKRQHEHMRYRRPSEYIKAFEPMTLINCEIVDRQYGFVFTSLE